MILSPPLTTKPARKALNHSPCTQKKRVYGECIDVMFICIFVPIRLFKNLFRCLVFTRAWEPEPGVFGSLKPEPELEPVGAGCFWLLEAGAGAA